MIKYRGKTFDGEWITGAHIEIKHDTSVMVDDYEGWLYLKAGHYIIQEIDKQYVFVKVIPESLGITFGSIDKNGKEIYASFEVDGKMSKGGDIVKNSVDMFYSVNFNIEAGGLVIESNSMGFRYLHSNLINSAKIEIIGNAFDNPELLEVE